MVKLSMIALIPLILFAQISLAAPVNGPGDTTTPATTGTTANNAGHSGNQKAATPNNAGHSGIMTKIKKCLGIKCPKVENNTDEFPMWQPGKPIRY
ncbi:hypothetical protein F5887DRAFT_587060 [Amanita rubescens]|nr:hypothetical protein F5887DRAFT_587060 [Amanita rubescens]